MSDGVLSDHELRGGAREGWIRSERPIADEQFQPASLDLRLGTTAYQLRASFLPFSQTVQERLGSDLGRSDLVIDRVSLESSATLQRGSVYLVPLLESLHLPAHVRGRSNPKSTTGRLDIFTRVITDRTSRFDEVRAGYVRPGARAGLRGSATPPRRRRAPDSDRARRVQRRALHGDRSLGWADRWAHRLSRPSEPARRRP